MFGLIQFMREELTRASKPFYISPSLSLSLSLRHIFLFDLAVIVCKRKGDNYEMKEIIDLQQYKIANNPTTDKENKKVNSGRFITVVYSALGTFKENGLIHSREG